MNNFLQNSQETFSHKNKLSSVVWEKTIIQKLQF